ncbi:MAG: helix-turn-helix transcriptional regulator [Clostridia bacterium]|nr:helix-turn-helix transcriptional regulator [Clostridia bacterium]
MDKKFCENLKSARKEANLTQKEVAKRLNVVESCYANWEQGRTEPNLSTLRQISVIFDVSLDDLING